MPGAGEASLRQLGDIGRSKPQRQRVRALAPSGVRVEASAPAFRHPPRCRAGDRRRRITQSSGEPHLPRRAHGGLRSVCRRCETTAAARPLVEIQHAIHGVHLGDAAPLPTGGACGEVFQRVISNFAVVSVRADPPANPGQLRIMVLAAGPVERRRRSVSRLGERCRAPATADGLVAGPRRPAAGTWHRAGVGESPAPQRLSSACHGHQRRRSRGPRGDRVPAGIARRRRGAAWLHRRSRMRGRHPRPADRDSTSKHVRRSHGRSSPIATAGTSTT